LGPIVAAFVAGESQGQAKRFENIANKEQVRDGVLVVAVGEHLATPRGCWWSFRTRSQAIRAEQVNISAEQRRAEDLLQENRLYRQTALQEGDAGLAAC